MADEGEGPAMTWVREYNAQLISLDELAKRIAGHDFRKRKGAAEQPTMARAIDYKDADYEGGTFDDVYRAKAYGLLTRGDMDVIMDRFNQRKKEQDAQEPASICQAGTSPSKAPLIELSAAPEPHLVKVDDGYIKIKVTG